VNKAEVLSSFLLPFTNLHFRVFPYRLVFSFPRSAERELLNIDIPPPDTEVLGRAFGAGVLTEVLALAVSETEVLGLAFGAGVLTEVLALVVFVLPFLAGVRWRSSALMRPTPPRFIIELPFVYNEGRRGLRGIQKRTKNKVVTKK
jgi:hypothetical protein